MVDVQVRQVVHFLQAKHVKIGQQNEWLQGCCSWFSSNNPQANIQLMQEFVYEQWLLADLRDIGESSLPTNISNLTKTCLREKLALQVDSVVNVGESCYSQLQKIRNVSTVNVDTNENKPQTWEPKSKRMLKLTCTDGIQTIYGMEYQLIPALREPFIPGIKILIIGPVECRRGILLLGPQNVQILGGEADSLIVKNATENVLARELGLEENPNPFSQTHPQNIIPTTRNDSDEDDPPPPPAIPATTSTANFDDFMDENDEIFLSEQLTQVENQFINETSQRSSAQNQQINFNVSNNFGDVPIQQNQTNHFPSSSRPINIANNSGNNNRKVGVANIIMSSNNLSSKRPAPSPPTSEMKIAKTVTNTVQDGSGEYENFDEDVIDSFSEEFSVMTSSENSKIRDIKKLANSNCTRKCNAVFLRITSKPKIRDETWQFCGEIGDDTGSIDVAFADQFLEKMFEFSAVEISSQKERMKFNPDVKERIDNILKRGVQKVMSLKGQYHVQFSTASDLPTVINVVE